jgi:hypothetical protein
MTNVIDLSAMRAKTSVPSDLPTGPGPQVIELTPREMRRQLRQQSEPATETCRNQRARLKRRDAWWRAERTTSYWRARCDWSSALGLAQDNGIGDADSFARAKNGERLELVERWRAALVEQMLTAAPHLAAVAWKRAKLASESWEYCDVKPERLQRAIDADVEWLAAHPSRKSANSLADK